MTSKTYIDIETNGLNPDTIWCVGADDQLFRTDGDFKKYLYGRPGTVYAHNGVNFDFPVLQKLWGVDWTHFEFRDTLIMARMADPERKSHSLESFGLEWGFPKGDHNDWSQFSVEMAEYCKQDVRLLQRVATWAEKELNSSGLDWEDAYQREVKVARIIDRQIKNGWLLDQRACWDLVGMLQNESLELEAQVREKFKPLPTFVKEIHPKEKADGTLSKVGLNCLSDDWQTCGGPFSRIDYEPFNLGSRQQIGRYLQWFGWKPEKFTETGQPMVDEVVLEDVPIPEAQLIQRYLMVNKRLSQVRSWLDAVDEDGRVHGYVNPLGAVTGRMTHSGPNMAQIPGTRKPHGKECRSCWIVKPGYKLVGVDADQLELVMLAHYMGDPEFTASIESGDKDAGTDVHTRNQKAAGLPTRDDAKTFIYAFLYGAGADKLGAIVGGSGTEGNRLKRKFLAYYPKLKDLIDRVKASARKGWIKGLDGRKVRVRSQHSALNTLLQSAGAIVMKEALVVLDEYATKWGLDFEWVGNIHDELQAEVAEKDAEKFAYLAGLCITKAALNLGVRCKLTGSGNIGDNWSETH